MATGLTNRDIAERLVITERTVEVHAKHILSKLALASRTQVAGWFARANAACGSTVRPDGIPRVVGALGDAPPA
jgi:hypothetical protein